MQKVIKKELNTAYTSFSVDILHVDSTVAFDCYIKRFNGYVIIIEQGTLITETLFEKIKHNKELYVHESELNKYKDYCELMLSLDAERSAIDKAIEDINNLDVQIKKYGEVKEQLHHVYKSMCDLGYLFFNAKSYTKLPLNSLETFIDITLRLILSKDKLLPEFLEMMPPKYQIEYHSVNVCILSIFLGHKIGFQRSDLQKLAMAALLHDIGKLQIDKTILDKESGLNPEEFETIREHSSLSKDMAANYISDKHILDAILYHHEKFDGSGYPEGLKRHDIPKMAQIVGICDAFDALTTDRTFRDSYSSFEALTLMKDQMTGELNQDYIKSFIQLLHK